MGVHFWREDLLILGQRERLDIGFHGPDTWVGELPQVPEAFEGSETGAR